MSYIATLSQQLSWTCRYSGATYEKLLTRWDRRDLQILSVPSQQSHVMLSNSHLFPCGLHSAVAFYESKGAYSKEKTANCGFRNTCKWAVSKIISRMYGGILRGEARGLAATSGGRASAVYERRHQPFLTVNVHQQHKVAYHGRTTVSL